jgi:hypothetical protein
MKNTLKTLLAVAFVAVAFSSCKPKEEAKVEEVAVDTVQVAEDTAVVTTDTTTVATDTTAAH